MSKHILFAALSLVLPSAQAAIGPVADLYIGNAQVSPDGFQRSAVLAGASATSLTHPGPLITAQKGDQLRINVIDNLNDTTMLRTTSIHWHGFFQSGSNWADGPVGVNQCPIVPGESFQYVFETTTQSGTFWYHSHHSTQYCDGLRGPLVVYDPQDPHLSLYDVDNETTVITLSDWYHVVAPQAGAVPRPQSTLINGIGRASGGTVVPLTVITVVPNTRYRFRLVNIGCDPNFTFSIDGHTLTIIEADTVDTLPLVVDSIQIFAGQRYSFILQANQPVNNYWIRANPNVGTTGFTGGINSAILRYAGASAVDPTTTQTTSTSPLVESHLVPLSGAPAPGVPTRGAADVNLNLLIGFSAGAFSINGVSFAPPSLPVLLQLISGTPAASLLPSGSIYSLPPNKVIELSIPGGAVGSPHPIHLHGHTFDVVRSAGSSVYNYANPIKRDVVSVGATGDNVTIRFTTDNAGPWIMHCHIDWHLAAGLAIVFAEDPTTAATDVPPTDWNTLCPSYQSFGPEFPAS